ncbi:MAG: hypothetical protein Q7S01_02870 [bacterium]|nr:hypothetical protein [bacterium]
MKYPWVAFTIVLLWIEATYTILSNQASNAFIIIVATVVCTSILVLFGFRSAT